MRDTYLNNMPNLKDIDENTWNFFLAYALFKGAAIAQGVYKRSTMGSASSTRGPMFLQICKMVSSIAVGITNNQYAYRIQPKEYSFLTYTPRFRDIRSKLIYFMERFVFGNESTFMK